MQEFRKRSAITYGPAAAEGAAMDAIRALKPIVGTVH
jgi:hypothetical protein